MPGKSGRLFLAPLFLLIILGLSSCTGPTDTPLPPKVKTTMQGGLFVLNEGNMSNGTGVLGYIDKSGHYTDSVYYKANGTLLGNVCQDLSYGDGRLYIISQNGERNRAEGMLYVIDAKTFERLRVYRNGELSALRTPTNITVVGDLAYIRDNRGIYVLHLTSNKLTYVDYTDGAVQATMIRRGDEIYTSRRDKLLVLKEGKVQNVITLKGMISGIAVADDNALYVSYSNRPVITKIEPATEKTTDSPLKGLKGVESAGSRSGIVAVGDTIYFDNRETKVYRHLFSKEETQKVIDLTTINAPYTKMNYGGLAVDRATGYIYFSTIEDYAGFRIKNNLLVFNGRGNFELLKSYESRTAFVATLVPAANLR